VFTSTKAVAGGIAPASDGVPKPLAAGTYYWLAGYSGDASNAPSTSGCGSEVLTVTPIVTIGGRATISARGVNVNIDCVVAPCAGTVTITTPTKPAGRAPDARAATSRATTVTLATQRYTLRKAGTKKLKVRLTKAGKRFLRADHGHVQATITVSQTTATGPVLTTRTIRVRLGNGRG
jgi:hypothetical protein